LPPDPIARHAPSWAGVGAGNAFSNQALVAGAKGCSPWKPRESEEPDIPP
jgi:hypothetical protein